MKNALMFVLAFTVILPLAANICAQTEPITPLSNLGTYQVRSLHQEEGAKLFTSDYLKSINAEDETYLDTPVNKAGVGVINAATSWTELPYQVARVSEEDNAFAGWTLGFGEGIVTGIARGVSGVIDIATCGLPPYDEPLMVPEYKVNKPDSEGLKIKLFEW